MNKGFLFAATQFEEWRLESPRSAAVLDKHPMRASLDDWYRLLRELKANSLNSALVNLVNTLWLPSFRFKEAGVFDVDNLPLIKGVCEQLNDLKGLNGQYSRLIDQRINRVIHHLVEFSKEVKLIHDNHAQDEKHPIIGSMWDITWETLVVTPLGRCLSMGYEPYDSRPFRIKVTPQGFVSDDGYSGYWRWMQRSGGRLMIEIGEQYPAGWGWYNQPGQQELHIHFYKPAFAHAFERMKWTRCR